MRPLGLCKNQKKTKRKIGKSTGKARIEGFDALIKALNHIAMNEVFGEEYSIQSNNVLNRKKKKVWICRRYKKAP